MNDTTLQQLGFQITAMAHHEEQHGQPAINAAREIKQPCTR
ncbi:MAG: hypothetical protein P1U83_00725 [Roseovarius sp.]|nr:hypothetical protein [Roseovarius sp.]